jgi:hypothetical protein
MKVQLDSESDAEARTLNRLLNAGSPAAATNWQILLIVRSAGAERSFRQHSLPANFWHCLLFQSVRRKRSYRVSRFLK